MKAHPFFAVLFFILTAGVLALAVLRTMSVIRYNRRRKKGRRVPKDQKLWTILLYAIAGVMLLLALLFTGIFAKKQEETIELPTEPPVTEPPVVYEPQKTANTDPANWGITWEIIQDGQIIPTYTRQDEVHFSDPEDYFALPGIAAFRGNNYRDNPVYGTVEMENKQLTTQWTAATGTLAGTSWSGSGWTGQPLIVKWDQATKQHMNLYPDKKADANLVEVIYATLDGRIYFFDLLDGSKTRDPIDVGMCFKGAGSLDPRGYPLMYVGSGDCNQSGERPRMFIISLIDGSILFEYGHEETMSLRTDNEKWCAFDSSPLVHAQSDTLIWPGESGVLYTMKLNTDYDTVAGTISVSPDNMVCARYDTIRSGEDQYWYGMEASIDMVDHYLYVSENGGLFFCVDINTMELVWAQDTKDDSNSSPVFEKNGEDGGYIYTAPSLHWTQDADAKGTISVYKLDAITGEIVWERPYDVSTVEGVSGGVQATGLLGKAGSNMEGLIIYPIARTPEKDTGILVALDTETGEEVWRKDMEKYAWSSPVAVYEKDGTGYVIAFDGEGRGVLLDGATGEQLDSIILGGFTEASPAVYNNMLVVGTREENIKGIKIG